jgi:hypothetical protein
METFNEIQGLSKKWVLVPLICVLGIFGYIAIKQIIIGSPVGNKPMPNYMLVFNIAFILLIIYILYAVKLETTIDKRGITVKLKPFVHKNILWKDIKSIEDVQYEFIGYGIRLNTKYGTVYNMNGNKGLFIKLKNGKKILIGTQNETELKNYIDTHKEDLIGLV